jgi:hypothetical protein
MSKLNLNCEFWRKIMKRLILLINLMALALLLAACGSEGNSQSDSESSTVSSNSESSGVTSDSGIDGAPAVSDNVTGVAQAEETVVLNGEYDGALSVQSQLALGTLQLEASELAVDEALAADLLPLWQAVQSLANSDTAAAVEVQAVVSQIQETMRSAQVAAIAGMQLAEDDVTALVESGDLAFGAGGRGFGRSAEDSDGGPGGGFAGGGPGGGRPGGLPGGGFAGGPGGGLGELSEDDRATRQAEFAEGGALVFQDRVLTGAVVRLLEDKTGVVSDRTAQINVFDDALALVAEFTGLTVEQIQTETAAGRSLAEIVEANGGDLAALQLSLGAIFSQLPNAADLDLAQATTDWLGLGP